MDANYIKSVVGKGLEYQFDVYSWENMIDDLDLTQVQKEWAKNHLTYTVREIADVCLERYEQQ